MKRILKILTVLVVAIGAGPLIVSGQSENIGINFESQLSWKEIKAKARIEKKYIFLDCYATWCGPCKWMNKNVFSESEVGDFMNANFVSVAVQMDQTAKDLDDIKNWYPEAKMIADSFSVREYPTYLFFSPDGVAVHKFTGTTENGPAFVTKAEDVLNPYKQYYTLLRNWKEHKEDSNYLFNALNAAIYMGSDQGQIIESEYIDKLKNPLTKDNIQLFGHLMHSSKESAFDLFLRNLTTIHDLTGNDYAESILCPIIFNEETTGFFERRNAPIYWNEIAGCLRKYPQLDKFGDQLPRFENLFREKINSEMLQYMNDLAHPDWKVVYKMFARRYPDFDIELIYLQAKLAYCQKKGLSEQHAGTALAILNRYGNILGDWEMNNLVWYHIFNITGDKEILNGALRWMKISVIRRADTEGYDTYANLLYKTGNFKEAIIWENKSIELATEIKEKSDEFRVVLEKMNGGQPTWKDNTKVSSIYGN